MHNMDPQLDQSNCTDGTKEISAISEGEQH